MSLILVREHAPLRHMIEIETPSGRRARWAADEPRPENVPTGWSKSSTMPGGWENFSGTLARDPARDSPDLDELSTIRIFLPGGENVGEYRLQGAPLTSGDQMAVSPQAVGWQAHLDDDQSAAMIYVDRDLSRWQGPSVQRQVNLLALPRGVGQPSVVPDATTGAPSLTLEVDDDWTTLPQIEGYYDAGSLLRLASLYGAWKIAGINSADGNWSWSASLSSDDILTSTDSSGNLRAAGPGTFTVTATATNRRFAVLFLTYGAAGGTAGAKSVIFFTCLAAYGDHGLTKRGTADATNAQGFYPSDIVAHAVARWAPKLAFTTGPGGTIDPFSTFVIPHLAFTDPTTASDIIKQASRFDLPDWAVWEGPTFYWNDRGARGKSWRARVGPAQLQETGPSIDRLWNSVVVRYQDVTGANRTVGPPGSGADATDAQLVDTDPENPANKAGVTRRALLSMGTTTSAGAIQVGARFLAYQKVISNAGQARLVGHVEDDRGVLWPVSRVRAGDGIIFPDAHDPTTERRIVRAEYTDDDKSCAIDLDAPPDALDALLERLAVELVPLGV